MTNIQNKNWCSGANFKTIPKMTCLSDLALSKLPKNLPLTLLTQTLKHVYNFTNDTDHVLWKAVTYNLTYTQSEELVGPYCGDNITSVDKVYISLYAWLRTQIAKDGIDLPRWVVTPKRLCCSDTSCLVTAPAPQPPHPPQILPTPTFVPRSPKTSLGVPPEFICTNPFMIYDKETDQLIWGLPDDSWLLVYNPNDETIPAYSAVEILGEIKDEKLLQKIKNMPAYKDKIPKNAVIYAIRYELSDDAEAGLSLVGIIDCEIGKESLGYACINGATNAAIPQEYKINYIIKPLKGRGKWGEDATGTFKVLRESSSSRPSTPEEAGRVLIGNVAKADSQQLVQITSVPPAGFGVGLGQVIVGVNPDGSYILGEEIPVFIPRL